MAIGLKLTPMLSFDQEAVRDAQPLVAIMQARDGLRWFLGRRL